MSATPFWFRIVKLTVAVVGILRVSITTATGPDVLIVRSGKVSRIGCKRHAVHAEYREPKAAPLLATKSGNAVDCCAGPPETLPVNETLAASSLI